MKPELTAEDINVRLDDEYALVTLFASQIAFEDDTRKRLNTIEVKISIVDLTLTPAQMVEFAKDRASGFLRELAAAAD